MVTVQEIEKQIEDAKIQHIPIDPLSWGYFSKAQLFTVNDTDGKRVEFEITEEGIGTMQWLFARYRANKGVPEDIQNYASYAYYTEQVRRWREAKIEQVVTRQDGTTHIVDMKASIASFLCRGIKIAMPYAMDGNKEELLQIHLSRGAIRGMTRRYNNEITDKDLLEQIVKNGMADKISHFRINSQACHYEMKVFEDDNISLEITNGFSGHQAMSYAVKVRLFSSIPAKFAHIPTTNANRKRKLLIVPLELVTTPIGSNRHLSQLQNTFDGIEKAINELKEAGINEWFSDNSNLARKEFEQLFEGLYHAGSSFYDTLMKQDPRTRMKKLSAEQKKKARELVSDIRWGSGSLRDCIAREYENHWNDYGWNAVLETVINAVVTQRFKTIQSVKDNLGAIEVPEAEETESGETD